MTSAITSAADPSYAHVHPDENETAEVKFAIESNCGGKIAGEKEKDQTRDVWPV